MYGHKFFSNGPEAGFGLIADESKPVRLSLLIFSTLDKDDISLTIRGDSGAVDLLVYVSPAEAMQMASRLRKMALDAFESQASRGA